MVDKLNNENVRKKDLEIILEVNRKSIEIETEVADQNEEIIRLLDKNADSQIKTQEKLDKIIKQNDEISKDMFKMQVLYITGLLALIGQIVQIFLKKT